MIILILQMRKLKYTNDEIWDSYIGSVVLENTPLTTCNATSQQVTHQEKSIQLIEKAVKWKYVQ